MTRISLVPTVYDVEGYAGDSLPFDVLIDDAIVAGRTWSAQIRDTSLSEVVEATFIITPIAGGARVMLPAAETARLANYAGQYDIQLAPADGGDPTTTILRGQLFIMGDITREA